MTKYTVDIRLTGQSVETETATFTVVGSIEKLEIFSAKVLQIVNELNSIPIRPPCKGCGH